MKIYLLSQCFCIYKKRFQARSWIWDGFSSLMCLRGVEGIDRALLWAFCLKSGEAGIDAATCSSLGCWSRSDSSITAMFSWVFLPIIIFTFRLNSAFALVVAFGLHRCNFMTTSSAILYRPFLILIPPTSHVSKDKRLFCEVELRCQNFCFNSHISQDEVVLLQQYQHYFILQIRRRRDIDEQDRLRCLGNNAWMRSPKSESPPGSSPEKKWPPPRIFRHVTVLDSVLRHCCSIGSWHFPSKHAKLLDCSLRIIVKKKKTLDTPTETSLHFFFCSRSPSSHSPPLTFSSFSNTRGRRPF